MDYDDKKIRSSFSGEQDRFKLSCVVSGDPSDVLLNLQVLTPDGSPVLGNKVIKAYVVKGDDPTQGGTFDPTDVHTVSEDTGSIISENSYPLQGETAFITESDGSIELEIVSGANNPAHGYNLVAWVENCAIQLFPFDLNDTLPS